MPAVITFFLRDEAYGWLSNFHRSPQEIDGFTYATNENFYQSKKAADPAVEKWIAVAPTPFLAMKAGRSLRPGKELVTDWETTDKKFKVMKRGLIAKFRNKELRRLLLETGNAIIHEGNPDDKVWGITGEDRLGKLIIDVRDYYLLCESFVQPSCFCLEEATSPMVWTPEYQVTGMHSCSDGCIWCPWCENPEKEVS